MNTSTIVQKLWNYCNVLRDDDMSYGDYPGSSPGQANNEQFALTLTLYQRERGIKGKMADERTKAPYLSPNGDYQKSQVPEKYSWPNLIKKDGDELFDHYRHTLEALGNQRVLLSLKVRCALAARKLNAPQALCGQYTQGAVIPLKWE